MELTGVVSWANSLGDWFCWAADGASAKPRQRQRRRRATGNNEMLLRLFKRAERFQVQLQDTSSQHKRIAESLCLVRGRDESDQVESGSPTVWEWCRNRYST